MFGWCFLCVDNNRPFKCYFLLSAKPMMIDRLESFSISLAELDCRGFLLFGDDGIPFRSMVEEILQCFIEYLLFPLIPKDGSDGPSSFGTCCPSWWILRKGLWLGLLYLELVIHLDGDWRKDCGRIFFILIVLLRIW